MDGGRLRRNGSSAAAPGADVLAGRPCRALERLAELPLPGDEKAQNSLLNPLCTQAKPPWKIDLLWDARGPPKRAAWARTESTRISMTLLMSARSGASGKAGEKIAM